MSEYRRRLMCAVQGGELPPGAIPCELIFTHGQTVGVDSGIVPTREMSFDADLLVIKPNNIFQSVIGYYKSSSQSSGDNAVRYAPIGFNASGPWETGYGYYWNIADVNTYPETTIVWDRLKYLVTVSDTETTVAVKDGATLISSGSVQYDETSTTFPSGWTLGLLGRKNNTNNNQISDGVWRGGVGRVKFYGDSHFGTLVADFIPCFYNGTFGFWDKVNKSFRTNSTGILGFGAAWNTSGFLPNCTNTTNTARNDHLSDYRTVSTSPKFDVPSGCTRIKFNTGQITNTAFVGIAYFNGNSWAAYNWYVVPDREVDLPANTTKIRLTINTIFLDKAYLYDVTNQQYIWRGTDAVFEYIKDETLPTGYTRVEYIGLSGGAYFDTGMKCSESTDMAFIDVKMNDLTVQQRFFGGDGTNSDAAFNIYINGSGKLGYRNNNNWAQYNVAITSTRTQIMVDYQFATTNVGTNIATFDKANPKTISASNTMIGCAYGSSNPQFNGNIYRAIIRRSGIPMRELIPCRDSNNVGYFYDVVNKTIMSFTTNGGTVTVGPDVA